MEWGKKKIDFRLAGFIALFPADRDDKNWEGNTAFPA